MKPTLESMKGAFRCASTIAESATNAGMKLSAAMAFFEGGCPVMSLEQLHGARENLVTLRRTQTAALENIDAAIKSAKGGAK